MRLFIAFDLPEKTKDELSALQRQLMYISPRASFVPRANFHCTLKFLDECEEDAIDSIADAMEIASRGVNAFEMELDRFGSFASGSKHTAIVTMLGDTQSLEKLYSNLELALKPLGFPREKRKLKPHITLARNCDLTPDSINRIYESKLRASFGVYDFTLYESRRGRNSMIYTPLVTQKLI